MSSEEDGADTCMECSTSRNMFPKLELSFSTCCGRAMCRSCIERQFGRVRKIICGKCKKEIGAFGLSDIEMTLFRVLRRAKWIDGWAAEHADVSGRGQNSCPHQPIVRDCFLMPFQSDRIGSRWSVQTLSRSVNTTITWRMCNRWVRGLVATLIWECSVYDLSHATTADECKKAEHESVILHEFCAWPCSEWRRGNKSTTPEDRRLAMTCLPAPCPSTPRRSRCCRLWNAETKRNGRRQRASIRCHPISVPRPSHGERPSRHRHPFWLTLPPQVQAASRKGACTGSLENCAWGLWWDMRQMAGGFSEMYDHQRSLEEAFMSF